MHIYYIVFHIFYLSDHHDITEILLKVALNTITLTFYLSKLIEAIIVWINWRYILFLQQNEQSPLTLTH
jgi:hypothetical protein